LVRRNLVDRPGVYPTRRRFPAEAPEIGFPSASGKYDDGVESAFQFHGAIAEAIASGRWLVAPVLVERGRREELAGGRGRAE